LVPAYARAPVPTETPLLRLPKAIASVLTLTPYAALGPDLPTATATSPAPRPAKALAWLPAETAMSPAAREAMFRTPNTVQELMCGQG